MTAEERMMYDGLVKGDRKEVLKMLKEGRPVDMRIPVNRRNDRGADWGLKKMTPHDRLGTGGDK